MDRDNYYVSVGSRTVQSEIPDNDYLEVLAAPDELAKLQALLARDQEKDEKVQLSAAIPYKSNDHTQAGDELNDDIINLYGYIYQIGTLKTKQHIEDMRILEKLQHSDNNHPGYDR